MTEKHYAGIAFLSHGFRPFFLGAGVVALVLIPLWLILMLTATPLPSGRDILHWHIHEMLFGYVAAAVAGFLLTAIPNWTGRLPVRGIPLLVLFLLWLGGRLAMAGLQHAVAASVVDGLFLIAVAFLATREAIAGNNRRNLPVCALVWLYALSNIVFHLEEQGVLGTDLAPRLALSVIVLLIGLIGGRIVPSFTTNWLLKNQSTALPVPFGRFDKGAMAVTLMALAGWVLVPDRPATGVLLLCASLLQLARLARWKAWLVTQNAIVLVMHVAYAWLPLGLLMLGLSALMPGALPSQSLGIHALTVGFIGMMTVAVMTRAILGHTGRALAAGWRGSLLYGLLFFSALARITAQLCGHYEVLLVLSATFWCLGFLVFVLHFGPMILRPRAGG